MMNAAICSSGQQSLSTTLAINTSHMSADMMSDGMSEPSSPDSSTFDASDLLNSTVSEEVSAQLAAVGGLAAAAIVTGKKKRRPHQFETNPSMRKRQQTRLLRKMKSTIEEYTTRVGQQAVMISCTPGKSSQSFKVFGSQPLETVMRGCKDVILAELENSLEEQIYKSPSHANVLHELPPLAIDGIPTPVDKMTQAQLRSFIPEMLKYSTGRSKPGWGRMECKPIWWPSDLPWANVRCDVRSEDDKQKVSWTEALRTIVKNCYRHHGRVDLLNVYSQDDPVKPSQEDPSSPFQSTATMVQTINNPDGTLSIIHIDTQNGGTPKIITLPDGTRAAVVQAVTNSNPPLNSQMEASQAVQTLSNVSTASHEVLTANLNQGNSVCVTALPDQSQFPETNIIDISGEARFVGASSVAVPCSVIPTIVGMYQGAQATADLSSITNGSAQSSPIVHFAVSTPAEEKQDDVVENPALGAELEMDHT